MPIDKVMGFSASQPQLAGARIRSGNQITDLGLSARSHRAFLGQVEDSLTEEEKKRHNGLHQRLVEIDAALAQEQATGMSPADKAALIREKIALKQSMRSAMGRASGQSGAPWQRRPLYFRRKALGVVRKLGRRSMAPPVGVEGLPGMGNFFTNSTLGVPNWAYIAAGGSVLLIGILKAAKRRKSAGA
jgi:hypothetical protein